MLKVTAASLSVADAMLLAKPEAVRYTVLPVIPEVGVMFTTGVVIVKIADALWPALSVTIT